MGPPKFGVRGGRDVFLLPPEHSHTVYCNKTHYESVYGVIALPWAAGVPSVVGTEELGPGGNVGGKKGVRYGGDGVSG